VTTIAAVQVRIDINDPESTRQAVVDAAAKAGTQGASVIVVADFATSGYVFHDLDEANARADR